MPYRKLNEKPIPIETIVDQGETGNFPDYDTCFVWQGHTYWMCDFIRCHNNPWIGDNFPEYIHGMWEYTAGAWDTGLFIELVGGDEAVNIYEYKEDE